MPAESHSIEIVWLSAALDLFEDRTKLIAALSLKSQVIGEDEGRQVVNRGIAYAGLGDAVIRSAKAVMLACGAEDARTAYLVCRALLEQSITLAYLAVCSDEDYATWEQYGFQKDYRLLDRSKSVGGASIRLSRTGLPQPDEIPGLHEALARFSGQRTGGEIKRWTKVTLDQMVERVQGSFPDHKLDVLFLMGLISCYEIGAEVQHATRVGATVQHSSTHGDLDSHLGLNLVSAAAAVTAVGMVISAKLDDGGSLDTFKGLLKDNLDAVIDTFSRGRPGPKP